MEYDKTTVEAPALTEPAPHETNPVKSGRGHVRVKGGEVDVSTLAQEMTLHFSGLKVKNRLMKAPMTERLCHWNGYGEDLVR